MAEQQCEAGPGKFLRGRIEYLLSEVNDFLYQHQGAGPAGHGQLTGNLAGKLCQFQYNCAVDGTEAAVVQAEKQQGTQCGSTACEQHLQQGIKTDDQVFCPVEHHNGADIPVQEQDTENRDEVGEDQRQQWQVDAQFASTPSITTFSEY